MIVVSIASPVNMQTEIFQPSTNVSNVHLAHFSQIQRPATVNHANRDFSKLSQAVVIVQLVLVEVIAIPNTALMVDTNNVRPEPITSWRDRRTRVHVSNVQMGRSALKTVPRTRRSVKNAHQEHLIMRPGNHNVDHAG